MTSGGTKCHILLAQDTLFTLFLVSCQQAAILSFNHINNVLSNSNQHNDPSVRSENIILVAVIQYKWFSAAV